MFYYVKYIATVTHCFRTYKLCDVKSSRCVSLSHLVINYPTSHLHFKISNRSEPSTPLRAVGDGNPVSASASPKGFIRRTSEQNSCKSGKIRGNLGKICKNLFKSLKVWTEMLPNVVWFETKWGPTFTDFCENLFCFGDHHKRRAGWENVHKKWPKRFSGTFSEIRTKIFHIPKNVPLPHLWPHWLHSTR